LGLVTLFSIVQLARYMLQNNEKDMYHIIAGSFSMAMTNLLIELLGRDNTTVINTIVATVILLVVMHALTSSHLTNSVQLLSSYIEIQLYQLVSFRYMCKISQEHT
jgi:hypothetical protein